MNTIIIRELDGIDIPDNAFMLDLRTREIKDCAGCWACWMKTPGRCAHKDMDDFYTAFLQADKAMFFISVSCDFVSGRLKTLFDRLIPILLPYTSWKTGESIHDPRYERYPDIEVYYQGSFSSEEARNLYEEYVNRVFYQFHCKTIAIEPLGEYIRGGMAI